MEQQRNLVDLSPRDERGKNDSNKNDSSTEVCMIEVSAVDEDNNKAVKTFKVSRDNSLTILQEHWGNVWGIRPQVIGFEREGVPVDHSKTPRQLGWTGDVSVTAVPLEDEESAGGAKNGVAKRSAAEAANKDPHVLKNRAKAVVAAPSGGRSASSPARGRAAAKVVGSGSKSAGSPPTTSKAKAASPARGEKGSSMPTAKAKAEASPARKDKKTKTSPAAKAKAKAKSKTKAKLKTTTKTKAKAKTKPQPKTNAKRKAESLECPRDADRIAWQRNNPKRAGSQAHERYEQYKKAKTVAEAFGLGALKVDISHDFENGFMQRV